VATPTKGKQQICLETTTTMAHMKPATEFGPGEPRVRIPVNGVVFPANGILLALHPTRLTTQITRAVFARDASTAPDSAAATSRTTERTIH
jgi:hypothetical protein